MSKEKRFAEIVQLSVKLRKEIDWISSCDSEKALENLVLFFQKVYPLQEEWSKIFSKKVYFKFNLNKNEFINELKDLFILTETSKHGWNRTEKEKCPSQFSVFVCPSREMLELYAEENIEIHSMSVGQILIKKFKISKKEEKYAGQFEQEVSIMNDIALTYMQDFHDDLGNLIDNFNYN
jgi:hypothetical protein